jgi:hypothetical protein
LLKTTIEAAVAMGAAKPAELENIILDTTVQEKPLPSRSIACCWK